MLPADVSSSGACRPARTMIFHPKKSNYKRESLAFYLCKAFPFHRLSVSRSECLFLIRTKRRCGRHSRGRPPGPRSSCWSGGSGRKSGRGKEGSPPGGLRPAGGISSGNVPGCRAENPAIRHAAKNRNVSRRSGNLKIIKTKIKLTSALFGSVADPIGKKGERLRSGRALTRRPRLWMPGHSPAAVRRTTARRRNRPRRR